MRADASQIGPDENLGFRLRPVLRQARRDKRSQTNFSSACAPMTMVLTLAFSGFRRALSLIRLRARIGNSDKGNGRGRRDLCNSASYSKSDGLDLAGILHIHEGMKREGETAGHHGAAWLWHQQGWCDARGSHQDPRGHGLYRVALRHARLRRERRRAGLHPLSGSGARYAGGGNLSAIAETGVDPQRIGVLGHSFGAAVAVYAGGVDSALAQSIAVGGWGDGVAKFREQHKSAAQWKKFIMKLEQGRRHRAKTGKPLMMPRFDIVPIPFTCARISSANAIMEFPAETAMSMMDFRRHDVVGDISPRPLLLLHPANDTVTPTSQAVGLFMRAKQPADMHLVSGVDHFMLNDDQGLVKRILEDWLARHFPV